MQKIYHLIHITITVNDVFYDFFKSSSAMCFKISLQKTAERFTSAVSNFIEVVIVLMN